MNHYICEICKQQHRETEEHCATCNKVHDRIIEEEKIDVMECGCPDVRQCDCPGCWCYTDLETK